MSFFTIEDTSLFGVKRLSFNKFQDNRGEFIKFFSSEEFKKTNLINQIKQINFSSTKKRGTVRGMHYQLPPFSEIKIVICLTGKVFDVALDLRKNSSTFLKYHGEILSSEDTSALLIPEGVAHGFQTMSNDSNLLYLHNQEYKPAFESGISPIDSSLNIVWPEKISLISERDKSFVKIDESFLGIES